MPIPRCLMYLWVILSRLIALTVGVVFALSIPLRRESRRTLPISRTTWSVLIRTPRVKLGALVGPVTLALTSLVQLETSARGAPSLRSIPVANLRCTPLPPLCSTWLERTPLVKGTSLPQGIPLRTRLRLLATPSIGRMRSPASSLVTTVVVFTTRK